MKLAAAALLALGLLSGAASARPADATFADIGLTAPRSVFDDIRGSAPRSPFDAVRETAPRSAFGDLRDAAPRSADNDGGPSDDVVGE